MKLFKVTCPVIDDKTPGSCQLYNGITIFGLNALGTPPHVKECKCFMTELTENESEKFMAEIKK